MATHVNVQPYNSNHCGPRNKSTGVPEYKITQLMFPQMLIYYALDKTWLRKLQTLYK